MRQLPNGLDIKAKLKVSYTYRYLYLYFRFVDNIASLGH